MLVCKEFHQLGSDLIKRHRLSRPGSIFRKIIEQAILEDLTDLFDYALDHCLDIDRNLVNFCIRHSRINNAKLIQDCSIVDLFHIPKITADRYNIVSTSFSIGYVNTWAYDELKFHCIYYYAGLSGNKETVDCAFSLAQDESEIFAQHYCPL
jgi:hypothetical protein